jgi:hypothetical protein
MCARYAPSSIGRLGDASNERIEEMSSRKTQMSVR